MKTTKQVETFFRNTSITWWNPDKEHDNRFWLFNRQLQYIKDNLLYYVGKGNKLREIHALDAGCGRGIHSNLLSNIGYDVTSLDINKEMLCVTGSICKTKLVEGSLMDLPFIAKSFDVVLSIGTSMHVESIDIMMSEIKRVMKDDAISIVSISNKYSLYTLWVTKFNKCFMRQQNLYLRRQFSYWAFKKIIDNHGFICLASSGFACIPPISLREQWRESIINPFMSKILSWPIDCLFGKYFGCGVTFVMKKR